MNRIAVVSHDRNYYKKLINDLWIALRPLSLTLAAGSTTLGIVSAWREGMIFTNNNLIKIILITFAGLLVQSGANLINDYFEGSFRYFRPSEQKIRFLGAERTYFDVLIFLWGMACFGAAALIGLYLIVITDMYMLYIGLAGVIGAYAYTGEPFVYKRRGLGVPLSFILMGPLMVFGAFALTALYCVIGFYPPLSLFVFATLPVALKAHKCVSEQNGLGIPYTNILHWTFTLILILTLI